MWHNSYFPIHIPLILEQGNIVFWSSNTMGNQANILWIENNWLIPLISILRYEYYFHNTWITEHTIIDNLWNNNFYNNDCSLISLYTLQSYFNNFRWVILVNIFNTTLNLSSLDNIYNNMTWLEREASEMYGINYLHNNDTRNLLLDYSNIQHPMLNNFPSEGVQDIFYNVLENQVVYYTNETVEL